MSPDYTVSESEKQSLMDSLRSHARAQLLSAQKTQATTVALKMKHKFMQAFLNDENHLPRRWRRNDQPRPVFVKAREVVSSLRKRFVLTGSFVMKSLIPFFLDHPSHHRA